MIFVLAIAVGYLIGSINPAAIIARLRGVDYRSVGSGNPGATNIGRAMGRKTGILVGVLDVLKGFLPRWVSACGPATSRWLRSRVSRQWSATSPAPS